MNRSSTIAREISSLWDASQVELTGEYSVERFKRLHTFSSSRSSLRIAFWCILTPLPCVLVLLPVDAAPLESPTHAPLDSPVYWTRGYFVTLLISMSMLEQLRQHLPRLQLRRRALMGVAVFATTLGVAFTLLLSTRIGHPLPFAMILGAPPWMMAIAVCVYWLTRRSFRRQAELKMDLLAYAMFLQLRLLLTLVYPAYVFVFTSLEGYAQTAFTLVLPLIKFSAKHLMARSFRHYDDLKPEALVFNIEVFHALFVSYSMHNASSFGATLVLMVIDVGHAWLSIRDVNHLADGIVQAMKALESPHHRVGIVGSAETPILDRVATILGRDASVMRHPSIRVSTWVQAPQKLDSLRKSSSAPSKLGPRMTLVTSSFKQIVPLVVVMDSKASSARSAPSSGADSPIPSLSPENGEVKEPPSVLMVRQTLKLLYVTEFIVLMEYVEVIVPVIFIVAGARAGIYMLAMFYLPNRSYYPILRDIGDDKMHQAIGNVLIYALLELLSLIAISVVLWRKLRLSALRQLTFVLETHWIVVQCALVAWVLFVVEMTLEHLGADFSFRFAWLTHHKP